MITWETVMSGENRKYLAYMLRLWQIEHDGKLAWRASIESPYTGERRGFSDMERLFLVLQKKTGSQFPADIGEEDVNGRSRLK